MSLPRLESDQDLAFQERSWRMQRVGWALMGLVLLGALVGLLGSGPLSKGSVTVPGIMQVEYQRFSRYQTSEKLTVHLAPAATGTPEVRLWIDRHFLDSSRLEAVLPPPVRVEGAADRLILVLRVAEPGHPLMVSVSLQPEHLGFVSGRLGLEAAAGTPGARVGFWSLVYP